MKTIHRKTVALGLAALVLMSVGWTAAGRQAALDAAKTQVARPDYDSEGRLKLPEDYEEWVLVGSSLGLSYSEGATAGREMFHNTLMEPGAYRHYAANGEFADGTMLALILRGPGEGVLPGRSGRFANQLVGVEMAVKDFGRFPEGWAYYGFGGRDGVRDRAEAFPKRSCHDCHARHAAVDNVFVQFYPLLGPHSQPAPGPSPATRETSAGAAEPDSEREPSVALLGLDPVMLVEGREEMGKAEIVENHRGFRYQFSSEPNRARFAADPKRYSMQNETCPVVPGAGIDPDIFVVHQEKIYAFATEGCRERFKADPSAFIADGPRPQSF